MSRDGFASLSASMLIRRLPHKNMSVQDLAEPPRATDLAPVMKLAPELRQVNKTEALNEVTSPATDALRQVPATDKDFYSGPERRVRDVSPLIERRRSVPPRIKISVRLEQHRYVRLRMASEEMGRTHQDIMTTAVDHYLDMLRIPRIAASRRDLNRS